MAEAITRTSWVWTDTGVEPTQGDEVYSASQPVAEYDNWAMYALTDDVRKLSEGLGAHASRHQQGGADELNLNNLSVGSAVDLKNPATDRFAIDTVGGTRLLDLNTASDRWVAFPEFNTELIAHNGLTVASGDTDLDGGDLLAGATTVWDASAGHVPASVVEDAWVDIDGDALQGPLQLGGDLLGQEEEVIYDVSTGGIPIQRLEDRSVTVTGGNQLSGGGTVTLGGSITLNVQEGAESGLDADLLDGQHASAFAQSGHTHDSRYYTESEADARFVDETGDTMSGTLAVDDETILVGLGSEGDYSLAVQDGNGRAHSYWNVETGTQNVLNDDEGASWVEQDGGGFEVRLYDGEPGDAGSPPSWVSMLNLQASGTATIQGNAIWTAGNDGSGSGLDADQLDGTHLAAIDWGDVALDQTDISVSHLGAANASLDMATHDIIAGGTTVWDASAGHLPQGRLQNDAVTIQSGSGLSGGGSVALGGSRTLSLTNDSLTVTAGDGLSGGGAVALGAATTLNIQVADFAGSGLQDDGAGNLEVADVSGALTITAGDHLTGGGTVELGGSTTLNVSDDWVDADGDTMTGDLSLATDDLKLILGASNPMSIRYAGGPDALEWRDETGNGDRMRLTTSGELSTSGQYVEGASI